MCLVQFSSVQSLSCVWFFATPWIAAHQASLSITNSRSSLRPTSIEFVMPSSHLIICRPLLLLPPIPPSIRVFSNESNSSHEVAKYWNFSFSISPSNNIYLSLSDSVHSIMCSRFIYLIRTDSDAFIFMAEQYFIVYIYHSFFIHSSIDGHLGCFHVPAIINSAAVNIGVHVSFSIMIS